MIGPILLCYWSIYVTGFELLARWPLRHLALWFVRFMFEREMVMYVLVLQEYSKWVSNTTINLLPRVRQYLKSVGPLTYFIDSGDRRRETDVKYWEKWDIWAKVATSGNYNPLRIAVKRTGSCPDHTYMVERSFYYQWIGRKRDIDDVSWFVMALCLFEAAIRRYKCIYFYFCVALKKPPDILKAGGKQSLSRWKDYLLQA